MAHSNHFVIDLLLSDLFLPLTLLCPTLPFAITCSVNWWSYDTNKYPPTETDCLPVPPLSFLVRYIEELFYIHSSHLNVLRPLIHRKFKSSKDLIECKVGCGCWRSHSRSSHSLAPKLWSSRFPFWLLTHLLHTPFGSHSCMSGGCCYACSEGNWYSPGIPHYHIILSSNDGNAIWKCGK